MEDERKSQPSGASSYQLSPLELQYKTKLCFKFMKQMKCTYGDKCSHAHGQVELRDELSNWKYMPSPCLQYSIFGYCEWVTCKFFHGEIKGKTKLCRNFEKYLKCNYGDKCRFAHGPVELREYSKYKTKPCQKYSDDGYCNYGSRCTFLHEEIKEKKEELCNRFPHLSKLSLKSLTDQTFIN